MKQKHGGARPNAGRKPAPYKTKVVAFRLKEEHVKPVRKLVKDFVNSQK